MKKKDSEKSIGLIIPIFVGIFNILIILFPAEMIAASKEGLSLWFNNVFPSLLPFIIGTNILTGLGAVSFLGALLEPLMQPLFGVPGVGGFALVTGMTSGYPLGAKVVAGLREDGQLTQPEAQRLVSFCNNSGPLFILGVVGVSMLRNPQMGYFIMAVHYVSAIITGLVFRYYGGNEARPPAKRGRIFSKALHSMRQARQKDKRNFGAVLGDSVKNAMETIAIVGGFIIFFSVLVKVIEITQLLDLAESLFAGALRYFNISSSLFHGLSLGLIEVTNGAKIISAESFSDTQIVMLCGIVSFGGFCIHAQAISFFSKTDIKASVYLLAKAIHCLISIAVAKLLLPFFSFSTAEEAVPAFLTKNSRFLGNLAFSTGCFIISIMVILIVVIGYNTFGALKKR